MLLTKKNQLLLKRRKNHRLKNQEFKLKLSNVPKISKKNKLLLVLKRKNSTKIATIETTVMITAVQTKMEMVKAIHKVEIIMIKTVQLVKDKIKGKNVINLLHQVAALQVIPLLQLLQGKIIVVIVTAKKRIATAIIQKMVTAKVDHFA